MERILSSNDKVRRAEEIYYRRKMGNPSSRFSKSDSEKKSYLGSKILLEILLVINLSIIIISIQNKDYIFTDDFLSDIQSYNVNITKIVKDFIGIDMGETQITDDTEVNEVPAEVEVEESGEQVQSEEIVPNEEEQASSSLNQMDEDINLIKELVNIQKPILEGTVTSRFGTRESSNKNVEGYHTGIDIGVAKRDINLFSNLSVQLL